MTPEEFNALPLTEQLKALQPGDELHLRGGGWLPFSGYNQIGSIRFSSSVAVAWLLDGRIFSQDDALDIIRVVRPTARNVPEVVEWLRCQSSNVIDMRVFDARVFASVLCQKLADHFEKETP